MNSGDSTDQGASTVDARLGLLRQLSGQPDVSALCLDETLNRVSLPERLTGFGFAEPDPVEAHGGMVAQLRERDQEVAIAAVLRARLVGTACAIVRRQDSDDEVVVHAVNMLVEWGVLVVVIGGSLRPIVDIDAAARPSELPRRLVHRRDRTGNTLHVDEATERLLGWTVDDMMGKSAMTFVDEADHDRAIEGWVEMMAGAEPRRYRLRYVTADGGRRWLEVTLTNHLADDGGGHVEVELIDVHDEMMALSAAKLGEMQFDALTDSLPVGVVQVNAAGEVVYANKWIRDLAGSTAEGGLDAGIKPADRDHVREAFVATITSGASVNVDATLVRRSDGRERNCRLRIRPLGVDDDGVSRGAIASIEDLTEMLDLQVRLRKQIHTDYLTGLANRLALENWIGEHLTDADVGSGVTILYFDLDGFKHVNDVHGHDVGDRLLRTLSARVQYVLGPDDLLARVGGDEFVIACPRVLSDDECDTLSRSVLDIFERDLTIDGTRVTVGCSIGIARTDQPDAAASVFVNADLAMYHAKRRGGQRWVCYGESLGSHADITGVAFPDVPSAADQPSVITHAATDARSAQHPVLR